MGYDAYVELTHRPIDRATWERIEEKFGGVMPETWEYNEKTGQIDAEDLAHNPDFDTVREIATFIAKETNFPVQIYWDDNEEGEYAEIILPDGRVFAEVRLFETDIGNVATYWEYIDAKMEKRVLEMTKNWDEDTLEQFNGTTFHVRDDKEVSVVIDREQGKVFFFKPNGDEVRFTLAEKLKLWDLVLKEIEEYNRGE